MNRLTQMLKELTMTYPKIKDTIWYYDFKKYADIEEQLGVDLITKDKIEQSSVCYWKDKDNKIHTLFINETERIGAFVENVDGLKWFLYYKDYGKTWSLDRQALEKEELSNG